MFTASTCSKHGRQFQDIDNKIRQKINRNKKTKIEERITIRSVV